VRERDFPGETTNHTVHELEMAKEYGILGAIRGHVINAFFVLTSLTPPGFDYGRSKFTVFVVPLPGHFISLLPHSLPWFSAEVIKTFWV
jgi:hypothetical protein